MLLEELAVVPSSMAVCARRIVMPLLAGIVALTHATVAVAQEEAPPREATPEPPKRDEKSPVKVTPLGYVEAYYTLTLGGTAWF